MEEYDYYGQHLSGAVEFFFHDFQDTHEKLNNDYLPWCSTFIIAILNTYMIICIFFVPKLRKVNFLMVFWQILCDIVSFPVLMLAGSLVFKINKSEHPIYRFFSCYAKGYGQLINEYSTGLVLAFHAVERLILVVFPFKSKAWLTKRFYSFSFLFIVVTDCMLWTAHGVSIFLEWEPCNMLIYESFWPNPTSRLLGNMVLFFGVPACICALCYFLITVQFVRRLYLHYNRKQNERKGCSRIIPLHWQLEYLASF